MSAVGDAVSIPGAGRRRPSSLARQRRRAERRALSLSSAVTRSRTLTVGLQDDFIAFQKRGDCLDGAALGTSHWL